VLGTLAVGVFGAKAGLDQLLIQLTGLLAIGGFSFVASFAIMFALKKTIGIRVSEDEELMGLDVGEHEMSAYADSPSEQMALSVE
jgi:Amt family ammonium transporter